MGLTQFIWFLDKASCYLFVGKSPICCIKAALSSIFQLSMISPSLSKCFKSQYMAAIFLLVGFTPITVVVCVAIALHLDITQSPSATNWSMVRFKSGQVVRISSQLFLRLLDLKDHFLYGLKN